MALRLSGATSGGPALASSGAVAQAPTSIIRLNRTARIGTSLIEAVTG